MVMGFAPPSSSQSKNLHSIFSHWVDYNYFSKKTIDRTNWSGGLKLECYDKRGIIKAGTEIIILSGQSKKLILENFGVINRDIEINKDNCHVYNMAITYIVYKTH